MENTIPELPRMQFERVFICLAISFLTKYAVGRKPKPLAVLQAEVSKIATDVVSMESSLNQLEYLYGQLANKTNNNLHNGTLQIN